MHSALTGVQVLVTALQCMPILLGFPYCDGRERESDRNIIFQYSFIGSFLSGVSYCDNRERVFMFDYDTKEKEHQNTRQSD
jgi:hypothetical protein